MKLQNDKRTRTWWQIELEFVHDGHAVPYVFPRQSMTVLVEADHLREAEIIIDRQLCYPKLGMDIVYLIRVIEAKRIVWGIEYVFPKGEK